MQDKRKIIWDILFLLLVFLLTVYGIFRGENVGAVLHTVKKVNGWWLIPGAALVVFFIWGESVIIWYMMRSFHIFLKKRICFLFSSVGFFFSCITPSASGGQPMQIYYMKKEKIPIPVSTVILMIVTITYKLVLVVIGLSVLIFGQQFQKRYLTEIMPVYYLGLLLNVFCVSFMTVLVFHPVLAEHILQRGLTILEKMHFVKKAVSRREKLTEAMKAYRETADYLKGHKRVIGIVILVTFIQRLALFAVTWTVYQAFGICGASMTDIVILQAVISVSVDMLPLPGGMGISETLFLKIFTPVFGSVRLPAMVLSRGLSYYSQLMISALFTAVAQIHYTLSDRRCLTQ